MKCFDSALGSIRSALEGRVSKVTAWHFGSGKSHFMAILHRYWPRCARALDSRTGAGHCQTQRVDGGKKFLLVPYHMVGAQDMDSRCWVVTAKTSYRTPSLSGPACFFKSSKIFDDARKLREKMVIRYLCELKWRTDAATTVGLG